MLGLGRVLLRDRCRLSSATLTAAWSPRRCTCPPPASCLQTVAFAPAHPTNPTKAACRLRVPERAAGPLAAPLEAAVLLAVAAAHRRHQVRCRQAPAGRAPYRQQTRMANLASLSHNLRPSPAARRRRLRRALRSSILGEKFSVRLLGWIALRGVLRPALPRPNLACQSASELGLVGDTSAPPHTLSFPPACAHPAPPLPGFFS